MQTWIIIGIIALGLLIGLLVLIKYGNKYWANEELKNRVLPGDELILMKEAVLHFTMSIKINIPASEVYKYLAQQGQRIGLLILLVLISISRIAVGQDVKHSAASLREGEILVLSNMQEETDVNGKEVTVVKYQAITIVNVSIQSCSNLLKKTSLHKDFINNAVKTEKIGLISDNEWLNYYSFKGGCNIADYDCILKVKYFGSHDNKSFAITGTAYPFIIEDKGLERIESYKVICAVRELENKKVEISFFMELVPNVSIPDWKIKMWYPDPVFVLEKIIDAAGSFQSRFNAQS